jgi:hypothetical protein
MLGKQFFIKTKLKLSKTQEVTMNKLLSKRDDFLPANRLETKMTPGAIATPVKELPLLFEGVSWREFKAVEQLLERPGYRLSFLDGVLEIRRMPGEAHETVKERLGALLEREQRDFVRSDQKPAIAKTYISA